MLLLSGMWVGWENCDDSAEVPSGRVNRYEEVRFERLWRWLTPFPPLTRTSSIVNLRDLQFGVPLRLEVTHIERVRSLLRPCIARRFYPI